MLGHSEPIFQAIAIRVTRRGGYSGTVASDATWYDIAYTGIAIDLYIPTVYSFPRPISIQKITFVNLCANPVVAT